MQRRLQPEVRTKTEGTPVSSPSPWIEWNISAINIGSMASVQTFASHSRRGFGGNGSFDA